MNMQKFWIVLLVVFSLCIHVVYAVDDVNKKVGTSSAQFLKIPVGARPAALADSQVAIADDANAILVNPAGAGFLYSPELQAMHGQLLGDLYYNFAGYIHPTKIGSFGVAVQHLGGSELTKIVNGVKNGSFTAYDAAGTLNYALQVHQLISAGINAKLIQSKLDDDSASAGAVDLGIKLRTPNEMFSFGLTGQHIGSSMKFNDESDPLPTMIRTGFGMKLDLPEHHSLI
ncbi:MAG: PorV/PorQ family protein, partial [Elusimicrobia bacterium]|nr:PorV/PorQ family protein [Elusimicrobiota bacterium]MBD3411736.1 PorV/PorQ family protein [Elusimicrobiota bacterium]